MSKKKSRRLTKAILETAKDMFEAGIFDESEYEKITLRHLKKEKLHTGDPLTSAEIRNLRENIHLSQAAFAKYLNLTVGYISQLERGVKQPKGAVLTLLNVIRRKGFEALL